MTDRVLLLAEFSRRYSGLRQRLIRKFRSPELAEDAMQETYLRLARKDVFDEVKNYDSYFFLIARNAAIDLKRSSSRLANAQQIDEALDFTDGAPDAERIVSARAEWRVLEEIIRKLPARQRLVLAQARLEGRSCREIAEDLGVSKRTVETDLRKALDFCAHHFVRAPTDRFASPPLNSSNSERALKVSRDV